MNRYIKIDFPTEPLRIRQHETGREVFDRVRKQWVALTPEEWVRQHFIQFILSRNYPESLIAVEKKIELGELTKRCDIVVYSRNMQPFMIVECKQMSVPLSQKVLDQILVYNIEVQPKYLIITNGSYTYGLKKENGQFVPVNEFPDYE